MGNVNILSHFSVPRWPLANKLGMIAKCLELGRIHCSTAEKLRAAISSPLLGRNLLFTDEGMIDSIREWEVLAGDKPLEIAMFIESPLTAVAKRIAELKNVKYLLGSPPTDASGRDLSILIKKFADNDILDLQKYLAFGCKVHQRTISNSRGKREAMELVGSYISQLGDPAYNHPYHEYARIVCELTDELILNAVFDANQRMRQVDRAQPFHLESGEEVQLSWGYDGEYFGVAVRDPFGRFSSNTIMSYVSSQRKLESIAEASSAGLGLKFIFERAHQIIANVQHEHVTEMIALVRFGNRMLEYENTKKSFYFFGDGVATKPNT